MAEPVYVNELKQKLVELGTIEDEYTKLKVKRDDLRDQVRKWLDINDRTEYETLDASGEQLWRMNVTPSSRSSVDHDLLKATVTPEQYDQIVTKNEFEVFKCQPVKSRKKNGNSAPKAPKGSS